MEILRSLIDAIRAGFSSVGREISSTLSQMDRQRVNIRSTSLLSHGPIEDTAPVELYTVPPNTRTELTELFITNTSEAEIIATLALVPKDEDWKVADILLPEIKVYGNAYDRLELSTAILQGWTVYIQVNNPYVVNVHLSGIEKVN